MLCPSAKCNYRLCKRGCKLNSLQAEAQETEVSFAAMPQALNSGWDSHKQPGVLANELWFAGFLLAPLLLYPALLLPAQTSWVGEGAERLTADQAPFPGPCSPIKVIFGGEGNHPACPELLTPLHHVGELL